MARSIPGGAIIAIIDPEATMRSALQIFFAAVGYDAISFSHPDEALQSESLGVERPAAIIMSYHFPDGVPWEHRIGRVRSAFPGVPVIVLTGDVSEQIAATVRQSGIPLFYKPASPSTLLETVEALSGRTARSAP